VKAIENYEKNVKEMERKYILYNLLWYSCHLRTNGWVLSTCHVLEEKKLTLKKKILLRCLVKVIWSHSIEDANLGNQGKYEGAISETLLWCLFWGWSYFKWVECNMSLFLVTWPSYFWFSPEVPQNKLQLNCITFASITCEVD